MKLKKIISGGQTGADRAGLTVAYQLGIPRGGWCPKGRRAEDGKIPDHYPMTEHESQEYPPRTWLNVRDADATVIFTKGALERGSALTRSFCEKQWKPWLHLDLGKLNDTQASAKLLLFLKKNSVKVLNVAGNRESKSPGIGAAVERVMLHALLIRGSVPVDPVTRRPL